MRKFKHKKTGWIVNEVKTPGTKTYNSIITGNVSPDIVEDSNDWEEIIEKDYKILNFVNNGKTGGVKGFIVPLNSDGTYGDPRYPKSKLGDLTLEKCIADQSLDIYSVKRLSDGEIFTVDDKICFCNNHFKLLGFRTSDTNAGHKLIVDVKSLTNELTYSYELKSIKHSKQPLFTTEDGVEIFENDIYYVINILGSNGNPNEFKIFRIDLLETINNNDKNCYKCNHIKTFSTKEKAQEYIDLHKPKYSLNDIKNILNEQMYKPYASLVLLDLKKLNKW